MAQVLYRSIKLQHSKEWVVNMITLEVAIQPGVIWVSETTSQFNENNPIRTPHTRHPAERNLSQCIG